MRYPSPNSVFVGGMLSHSALTSLHQDYIGKEEFIRLADQNWAPASLSVPVAVAILAAVFIVMYPFIRDAITEK